MLALAGTVGTGRDLSAGLRVRPTAEANTASGVAPASVEGTDPATGDGWTADGTSAFPLSYELPAVGNTGPAADLMEPATESPPYPARPPADDGNGPVLIPALPAWVVGGTSMLVFAPLMKSRRLWRRLLR